MFTVSSLRNFWYQDEIVEYDYNRVNLLVQKLATKGRGLKI